MNTEISEQLSNTKEQLTLTISQLSNEKIRNDELQQELDAAKDLATNAPLPPESNSDSAGIDIVSTEDEIKKLKDIIHQLEIDSNDKEVELKMKKVEMEGLEVELQNKSTQLVNDQNEFMLQIEQLKNDLKTLDDEKDALKKGIATQNESKQKLGDAVELLVKSKDDIQNVLNTLNQTKIPLKELIETKINENFTNGKQRSNATKKLNESFVWLQTKIDAIDQLQSVVDSNGLLNGNMKLIIAALSIIVIFVAFGVVFKSS
ncbi:hypothetical protein QTN25_002897 [Entamoeba marina]